MVENYRTAIFQDRMPVFDGRKNLYTAQPLPIDKQKVGRFNPNRFDILLIVYALVIRV